MSYVIAHPDVEGTAVIPERTLATHAARGWVLTDPPAPPAQVPATPREPKPAPPPREMKMPARSASSAAWKTYAVVAGMPYAEAIDATRDQLVERYRPAEEPSAPKAVPKKRAPKKAAAPTPNVVADDTPDEAAPVAETPKES